MSGDRRRQTGSEAGRQGATRGRRASVRLAACGEMPRERCDRYLASLLEGSRADRTALRRVGRQNCAIFQCMEERGLGSCTQCGEVPCIFHDQLDRICPAGHAPEEGAPWRLQGPSREAAEMDAARRHKGQVPERCIARLRWYLVALEQFRRAGVKVVSSADLAGKVGVSSSLVRRDLCYFGQFGTPSVGYQVDELSRRVRGLFQGEGTRRAAWVGVERLLGDAGALEQFAEHDWQIIAAFDPEPERAGTQIGHLQVMHITSLADVVQNLEVDAAVLAVPEAMAQEVAEQLVESGVDAILNLTAAPLALPQQVAVQQADLATQLMLLSYHARLGRGIEDT